MDAAKAELLRGLGQVVRGLSTLFWGLPLALILYLTTVRTDWLGFLGDAAFLPATAATAMLWIGLRPMREFQPQERIWQMALTRAEFLALINTGLAPFLFWWRRFPNLFFYFLCIVILLSGVLLFMMQLNCVLRRLCAMLPDEALRAEATTFTNVNITLLFVILIIVGTLAALDQMGKLPPAAQRALVGESPRALWFGIFIVMMPLALTLSMVWRIKEFLFTSIFAAER